MHILLFACSLLGVLASGVHADDPSPPSPPTDQDLMTIPAYGYDLIKNVTDSLLANPVAFLAALGSGNATVPIDFAPYKALFAFELIPDPVQRMQSCLACRVGALTLLNNVNDGTNVTSLVSLASYVCLMLNETSADMCFGLMERLGPVLYLILNTTSGLDSSTICGLIFEASGCVAPESFTNWTVPEADPAKCGGSPLLPDGFGDKQTLKILHLTDIHFDPLYAAGSESQCDEYLCCRGDTSSVSNPAGPDGSYGICDIPMITLNKTCQHIVDTYPDIDIIFMGGDLTPHFVWGNSKDMDLDIVKQASDIIAAYFPNTTIVPVTGNHDVYPVNLVSPLDAPKPYRTSCMYKEIADKWESLGWLRKRETFRFRKTGSYAFDMTETCKIIALNTNRCYTYNYWLLNKPNDPDGELLWLKRQLLRAKKKHMKVYILGHVPPHIPDCWSPWGRNYRAVVLPFWDIIEGQFFGHTHTEDYGIYYDDEDRTLPRLVSFTDPSLSTWGFKAINPGYKIFTVNATTMGIMSAKTDIFDLGMSYTTGSDQWRTLYDTSNTTGGFHLRDLSPAAVHELVQNADSDSELFNKYYDNVYQGMGHTLNPCNGTCKDEQLYGIVTQYSTETEQCCIMDLDPPPVTP